MSKIDQAANSPIAAEFRARLLLILNSTADKQMLDDFLFQDTGIPPISFLQSATPEFPAWYMADMRTYLVILIDGITTEAQARAMWQGYLGAYVFTSFYGNNPWLASWANMINTSNVLSYANEWTKTIICGYSAGGAVAFYLNTFPGGTATAASKLITTFGSPSPFAYGAAGNYEPGDVARWFGSDDPVPLIPYSPSWSWLSGYGMSPTQVIRLSHFRQPQGGIQIGLDLTLVNTPVPVLASLDPPASISAWMFAAEHGVQNAHSILTYTARLRQMNATQPQYVASPPRGSDPQASQAATPREARSASEQGGQTIINAAGRQAASPVVLPKQQAFYVKRAGKFYRVYFGDQIIVTTPRRRSARSMAAHGNDFLRTLQRQALVDPAAMATQMKDYLVLASNPDSGFVPQLNVRPG